MREVSAVETASVGSRWNRRLGAVALAACLLTAVAVPAEEVEIFFTASLVPGSCGADCLGGLGPSVSGSWVFESASTGSGGNPNVYPLQTLDFTTAFGVIGGATGGTISIANNLSAPPTDGYTVGGTGTFGTFAELVLASLSVQLLDTDGTVFADTSLPSAEPPLGAFETARVYMSWQQGGIPIWAPAWDITVLSSTVLSGGDCCSAHAAPGCDDSACEADVCAADPACCVSGWDSTCEALAAGSCTICGAVTCPGVGGGGPNSALDEQLPLVPPFNGTGGTANSTRGWRFRPTVPGLVVTRLGVNTEVSSSISHTVTLFDFTTEQVLGQGTSPIGSDWQWTDIPPVVLRVGSDYVVQAHSAVSDWYYFGNQSNIGSTWFPTAPIEYVEMRYDNDVTDPSGFPPQVLSSYQYGLVDVGYAYSACVEVPGPGAGEIVDPAIGPPGRSFEFFVSDRGTLLDLDVGLRLHSSTGPIGSATYWDDYSITLSKGSRSFILNANPVGGSNGVFDVTFDSDAATSIQSLKGGDAIGPVRPDGPYVDPFDGVMLGGPWTLTFEETCCVGETRLDGWELLGDVMEEQTVLRCDDPASGTGGDSANSRGIRFHVDRDFQGVRLDLTTNSAGTYRFDAELRRSTGFTAPVERTATMEADLVFGSDASVPIYFDDVAVSGLESFTLKFTNIVGPGSMYFDTFGGGSEPCPNVEETEGNTSATPIVRGDPADFSVIAVPEPGGMWALVCGAALLLALEGRRRRS